MLYNIKYSITVWILMLGFFNSTYCIEKSYTITDFGAIGDAKTLNTKAIQATIDKCSDDGGGWVIIPKGTFVSGALFLKKGVNLKIEKDGIIKGSLNKDDYPIIFTRWEGVEKNWLSALINIIEIDNIEISGEGTIDGSGIEFTEEIRQFRQRILELPDNLIDSLSKTAFFGRPRLICFQNCNNVKINGIKLLNQASWGLHILYCNNVSIKNLFIRAAHNIPSSDGIDIDSSEGVKVEGCNIDCNDDCISIKSGRDSNGLKVNKPSKNIVIKKCRFGYGHGGVAIGSETSGGIKNVKVTDCIADSGNWAPIRFKTQPSRGGIVENIVFRNIKINNTRQAFEMNMEWRMVPPVLPPAEKLPVFRNITFYNIRGTSSSIGFIHGLDNSPIYNVKFKKCKITAIKGLFAENIIESYFSGLTGRVNEGQLLIFQTTKD